MRYLRSFRFQPMYEIKCDVDFREVPAGRGPLKVKAHMSDEVFLELIESLEEALQHARGERTDLRTTVLPVPPPIFTRIR